MKNIHPFTTIAALMLVPAAALIFMDLPSYVKIISAGLALAAYFCAVKEVAKFTSWYQFITVFLSGIVLGLTLDNTFTGVPWMIITCFVAAASSILRIVFFRWFGYTGYTWFEPTMTVITLGLYITGNLVNNYAWQGWAFPGLIIAFQAFLAYGIMKDTKQLLSHTKHGYKIEIGKEAPDFTLPDQDENPVSLSSFKGKRDLLLIFVRGDWCPGCHMMLRTYERERERFQKKNIMVMAIGPDPVGVNREMVQKLGLDFKVLSDEGQKTAKVYGIQLNEYEHVIEDFSEGIPLPASFLIDRNGIVRYVSRPDKVGEFLNPSLIFPIVESLGEVEPQKVTA